MNNLTNYRLSKTMISSRHIFCITLIFTFLNFIDVGRMKAAQAVKSPDGNVVITFDVRDVGDQRGCLVYSVTYKNRPIIVDSRLGLAIKDAPGMEDGFNIVSVTSSSNNNIYSPSAILMP